jgi:peptide/nickel transport system permease protein/oligopeptide transport system permease protein
MTDQDLTARREEGAVAAGAAGAELVGRPRSLFSDAWRDLRRNPIFWVSAVLILVLGVMAAVPSLFTSVSPTDCNLSRSFQPPGGSAWFGYDLQGCDVYSRTIYGARASILVGLFSTTFAGIVAVVLGVLAGYFGGWVDVIISRLIDIVFGIPLLLGALVLLKSLSNRDVGIWGVVFTLGVFGWTTAARVMRSTVIATMQQDYVQAVRALGAGHLRIMLRHVLPNAIAPVVVVLTILLGGFIAAEATLSFLGIGLQPPSISWGIDISEAQRRIRQAAHPLLFPAGFLSVTVLAFIMLGDAIRDAFDPRLR